MLSPSHTICSLGENVSQCRYKVLISFNIMCNKARNVPKKNGSQLIPLFSGKTLGE